MLTSEEILAWYQRRELSLQAQEVVEKIRSSPPARRVGTGRRNVSIRFPSRKMGVTIQAESRTVEFARLFIMEHDPTVLEFWDQPPSITLRWLAKTKTGEDRPTGVVYTPDFFVISEDGAGWEEWKTEEDLRRLAEEMPNRYVLDETRKWRCPPGEAIAEPLGLSFQVRSSAEIPKIFLRNLRFIAYYLREDCPGVSELAQEEVLSRVFDDRGITLDRLLKSVKIANSDDIYTLIAKEQIYVDLYAAPFAEPDRVHLYCDEETARAWRIVLAQDSFPVIGRPRTVLIEPGAPVVWDGRLWTILQQGQTTTSLLSEDKRPVELSNAHFQALVAEGKLVGLTEPPQKGSHNSEVQARFKRADIQQLKEASDRYEIIRPVLNGEASTDNTTQGRKIRRWVAKYREAERTLGCGYVGLLPDYRKSGNRLPRLTEKSVELINQFIETQYETHKQKNKSEVYAEFVTFCENNGLPTAPSYRTFVAAVNSRPRYEQVKKRAGHRAAYAYEPRYLELDYALPPHGDRPFEIVHLDHTELDVQLVDSQKGHQFGRPWATFLTDAFSRRLLAVYLTFDRPSYRSCMMALRECVHRFNRFPEMVVVDWGPEFQSDYFETLLSRYECSKATRPKAKPRFGSVIERLFGTANTQFVHNLAGNTQVMKNVRQVTKSNDPREEAVWTLGELYAQLRRWAYVVYDNLEHGTLKQTPKDAFESGLHRTGARRREWIDYDDDFIRFTLPGTSKGTAKLKPLLGVKINSIYYMSKDGAFDDEEIWNTQLPVRYDPFDVGHAYALANGEWTECISEHYASFQGRSEREKQIASEELRKRNRRHGQQFTVSAAQLAEFITSVESIEALLPQRLRDHEASAVFALMEGTDSHGRDESSDAPLPGASSNKADTIAGPAPVFSRAKSDAQANDEICEDY